MTLKTGSDGDDEQAEAAEEAAEGIVKEGAGPHSAICTDCGYGASKQNKDSGIHRKAIHHAMSKGHTVHMVHGSTNRAVEIRPRGHVSSPKY